MAAGTSIITEKSPYIVRTSFTLAQSSDDHRPTGRSRTASRRSSAWSPTTRPATTRRTSSSEHSPPAAARSSKRSGCRWPIRTSRRSCSAPPTPSPTRSSCSCRPARAASSCKQFAERGLDKAGIKVIGPGDVTDDDLLNGMGDAVLGTVTAHIYSADASLRDEQGIRRGLPEGQQWLRPNFMAVGGYDGMHLIYEALKKTGGKTDGDSLIAAMKGMAWESPRGPISIDPETRDIIQNIYIRKVEKVERRTLQRRVRNLRGRQGSRQDQEVDEPLKAPQGTAHPQGLQPPGQFGADSDASRPCPRYDAPCLISSPTTSAPFCS